MQGEGVILGDVIKFAIVYTKPPSPTFLPHQDDRSSPRATTVLNDPTLYHALLPRF